MRMVLFLAEQYFYFFDTCLKPRNIVAVLCSTKVLECQAGVVRKKIYKYRRNASTLK